MPVSRPPRVGVSHRIACKRVSCKSAARKRVPPAVRASSEPTTKEDGAEQALVPAETTSIEKPDTTIDMSSYRSSVEQVKAIAAKISAARRLARKLAEEKAAVAALSNGDSREAELIKRKTQLNSAEAAAAAARADALARSSKLKASSRSREAARLAAENKALLEVLTTVAEGNPSIQAKLSAIRHTYPPGSPQAQDSTSSIDAPTGTIDTSSAAPPAPTPSAPPSSPTPSRAPPSAPPKPVAATSAPPTPTSPSTNGKSATVPRATPVVPGQPTKPPSAVAPPPPPAAPAKEPPKVPPASPVKVPPVPTPPAATTAPKVVPGTPTKPPPAVPKPAVPLPSKVPVPPPAASKPPGAPGPPPTPAQEKAEAAKQQEKEKGKEQKSPPIVDAFKGVLGALGGAAPGDKKSKDKPPSTVASAAPVARAPPPPAKTPVSKPPSSPVTPAAKAGPAVPPPVAKTPAPSKPTVPAPKVKAVPEDAKKLSPAAPAAAAAAPAKEEEKKADSTKPAPSAAAGAKQEAAPVKTPPPPAAETPPATPAPPAAAKAAAPAGAPPKGVPGAPGAQVTAPKEDPKEMAAQAKAAAEEAASLAGGAPAAPQKPKEEEASKASPAAPKATPKPPSTPAPAAPPAADTKAAKKQPDSEELLASAMQKAKARREKAAVSRGRGDMDDILPDPEAVAKLKAKAEEAAEAAAVLKASQAAEKTADAKEAAPKPRVTPEVKSTAQEAATAAKPAAKAKAPTPARAPPAAAAPTTPKRKVPDVKPPPITTIVSNMKRKGLTFTTDIPARPGSRVRILVDKSRTVFATDDNEHHMQLKLGINNWEDIHVIGIAKVTEVPDVTDVYIATVPLPDELFGVDFVVQDYRTTKVDNNFGSDYQLTLVDAPSEEEILDRRAREFEAAERDRLAQIAQDEAKIAEEVAREREAAESDAMHEWWRVRRGELRQRATERVAAELGGHGDGCADSMDGVFTWLEGRPDPGKQAILLYNRDCSELRHRKELVLHLGCNGWAGQKKELYSLTKAIQADLQQAGVKDKGGNWYSTKCVIPKEARIIDFVISDKDLQVWDNNHHRDFHTRVQSGKDQATLEEEAYRQLLEQSLDSDTEFAQKAARKAGERVRMRAEAQRKRRSQQRRVLYTNPLVPVAGETCEVYYNPDMTALSGRPEVYMRGSWNRWTHRAGIPTTKLEPAFTCGIGFMKATVQVPPDALVADFVFLDSENEQAGFYDNNNGLDYHVPVVGAKGTLPPLRIAHVSVEMAPIAKVGGMGDVVTALGRAVQEYGHEVEVIMPKYDCLKYDLVHNIGEIAAFHWGGTHIRVFRGQVEGLDTTFLEPDNGMFWVGCVYGRNDDAHRFNFFCGAALEYLKNHARAKTDVVHCHDWPTAPVAFGDTGQARPVFTIHNLNYGADLIGRAMAATAVATTVSPTYAQEISGHPAVAPSLGKMFGVRNGIDVDIWDPSSDPFLPVSYSVENFEEGKAAAKRELRKRMNLSETDVPVVGVVTRLTHQKGIHLIKHAAWRTLERGGQFVLLGSAPDPRVQADFNSLANDLQNQYNDRARLCFAFDEPLSHLIYAGCDIILVPSMFEPCGLTQMIGMRYGTIAVVRKTGGLADTVFDVDDDVDRADHYGLEVNGFNFEGTDNGGLDYALNRSMNTWYSDRDFFNTVAKRCMSMDWSWYGPAQDYIELYYRAIKAY